jgi:hypothetical protein
MRENPPPMPPNIYFINQLRQSYVVNRKLDFALVTNYDLCRDSAKIVRCMKNARTIWEMGSATVPVAAFGVSPNASFRASASKAFATAGKGRQG